MQLAETARACAAPFLFIPIRNIVQTVVEIAMHITIHAYGTNSRRKPVQADARPILLESAHLAG